MGWTTGTEREVVVGWEGVEAAEERFRQIEPEMVLKKPFLAKLRRGPTQTLPIGPVLRPAAAANDGDRAGQSLVLTALVLVCLSRMAAAERGAFRREVAAGAGGGEAYVGD